MRNVLFPVAIIGFLVFQSPIIVNAQKNPLSKWGNTIQAADVKKHIFTIAGPEMEGRNTPSAGLNKAADYIENYFKQLGLEPGNGSSFRQYYPVYKDSVSRYALAINGTELIPYADFDPNYSSNYTSEMFFSQVVFAGYGIIDAQRNDYKNINVQGKLVLIIDEIPADYKRADKIPRDDPSTIYGKLKTAKKNGAAALLIISSNFPRKERIIPMRWHLEQYRPSIMPITFFVSEATAAKMLGRSSVAALTDDSTKANAGSTYAADVKLAYQKEIKTEMVSNVLGKIEGSDKKDEYVFITAHYDHLGKTGDTTIYYGADDDGSGTTGLLELAEAFSMAKKGGKAPSRSIILMAVSGEERGLWGSNYYANHPVFDLNKTSVDLNIDMIGRVGFEYQKNKDSANYVYIIGDDKLSSELNPITEKINKRTEKLLLDRKYNDINDPNRFYYRSDHYNFAAKGVPIIFYFNGVHEDYHKPTDTPDKINYSLLAKRARLVFYTAYEIANLPVLLKRDIPLNIPER